jgi:hypothetical protein
LAADASAQPSPPAPIPSAPASPGTSYYFLDAAPPPPAAPVFPQGDYDFDPAMLPDLGLLAGPYDSRMDRRNFPV